MFKYAESQMPEEYMNIVVCWQLEIWQWSRGEILEQKSRFGSHQHIEAMNMNELSWEKREGTRTRP